MFPRKYTLEEAAGVVWEASLRGRANARNGYRSSAFAYSEALKSVARSDGNEKLRKIAKDAAINIELTLTGAVLCGF